MPQIVGVRLTTAGRVHYFDPNGLKLQVGDRVTVEDDHGEARGEVVISADQVLFSCSAIGL